MENGIGMTILSWIIRPFIQPEFWLIALGVWIGFGICAILTYRYVYPEIYRHTSKGREYLTYLCADYLFPLIIGPLAFWIAMGVIKEREIIRQTPETY
jgi:hypothetical protein